MENKSPTKMQEEIKTSFNLNYVESTNSRKRKREADQNQTEATKKRKLNNETIVKVTEQEVRIKI